MQELLAGHRRIFDVHHHLEPAPQTADGGQHDVKQDLARRVQRMDRLRLSASVLMVSHDYDRPLGQSDTQRQNDFVKWYRDQEPGRFPVAIGTVEPAHGIPACLAELARIKAELDLDGVVWEPSSSGELINEPRTVSLSKAIAAAGLPIFIHLTAPGLHEAPHYFESLSRAAPECTFVGLGALSSLDNQHDLRSIAVRCPNLLLDTSHVLPTGPIIADLAELIGSERLLFGTDVYGPSKDHFPGVLVDILESGRLSEEDKENILWRNAERLFPKLKALT